jgi:general secretion pathway protein C
MQALPLGRSSLAQTVLVSSLTLVAVALLGAVLAYWTWQWFAPRAEMRVEAAAVQSGSVTSAGTIFGKVARSQVAAPTGIAIKLLGVVAASGGRRGYAVVQLEAKQILAVHEGEDVAPGIRLAEVHADHVILERNGLRETLALPQRKASAGSAPRSAQAAGSIAARAAQAVAPQAVPQVAPRARGSRRRAEID